MTAAASFMNELMYISRDITWKDEYTANQCETRDTMRDAAIYMAAKSGDINFTVIPTFTMDVLEKSGVPSNIRLQCYYDKWKIPENYRANCVLFQTEHILASYEEKNEYYRMLNGLPPLADEDNGEWIYVTDDEYIDPTIPIHQLPITEIYNLDNNGYIDKLIEKYPNKKYLRYLGKRKIDPYVARSAEKFSLLYMASSDFVRIDTDFRDLYAVCRYAVIRSVYSGERRKENEYYDNFMAMMILFMTINQMFARYLDADINRDFYDYESIKYVYDHYGVPFYPEIPLEYHIKIIKNINILLRYKGSTEVFYKLFDIFNFGAMEVFDYYIVKMQKMSNGKPIFVYNEDGTENVRAMYDIKFGEVELYNNPPLELSDPDNIKSYSDLTAYDPYWVDDDEMLDKLYNMDYNYIESKYMGFSCVFDLMAITYESAIFFKLMFDTRYKMQMIHVYYNALSTNITLYDLIIYTCALICKRYGYDVALNKPSLYIEGILGFNLKADMAAIRQSVIDDPNIGDDVELINLLVSMNIDSIGDVNRVFTRIDSLRKLLTKRKAFAKTREEFQAYSNLEKTLMTSKFMEESFLRDCDLVYNADDPDTWYGFSELLEDINYSLAEKLAYYNPESDPSSMDVEIQAMLVLIRQTITSLEYIELCCSGGIETMLNYLFKMLDFFKSAKAQLTGFQVSYKIGGNGENAIKLFFDYNYGEIEIKTILKSFINRLMVDIHRIFLKMSNDAAFKLEFIRNWEWNHVYIDDFLTLLFRFKILQTIVYESRIEMDLHDEIRRAIHSQIMKDKLLFDDDMKLIYEKLFCDVVEYYINDEFKELTDIVIKCTTTYHYIERSDMDMIDELQWNLERILPDGVELPLELKQLIANNEYVDNFDNLLMNMKYSPIDLDKNFNWLISMLGESLMYIHDDVHKVSDTLYLPIKNKMYYMLRYLIRAYHSWVRDGVYYQTKLRWIKSHTRLVQLFEIVYDLHVLTNIDKEITKYNIDYDLVMNHVYHKLRLDESLDLTTELTLLYEYIERYYFEYIVNDQFEELLIKLLDSWYEVQDIQKIFFKLKDILQDRAMYKDSDDITYKFRLMSTDIDVNHHDVNMLFDLNQESFSTEQIEIITSLLVDFVMNHIRTKHEIKAIEEFDIKLLLTNFVSSYVVRNSSSFKLDDKILRINTCAEFDTFWKFLVETKLALNIIKDKFKDEFGLYTILYKVHNGYRIDDVLTLHADDEPNLIYERIYSEMMEYLLNDEFETLCTEIYSTTYEYHNVERFFFGYDTSINQDVMNIFGSENPDTLINTFNNDPHKRVGNVNTIRLYVEQMMRYYHYADVASKNFDYRFEFSGHDVYGNPGILLSILGESVARLFAHIHLNSDEIASQLKGYFSMAISRITTAYNFLLDEDFSFVDEVKHFDLGTICEDLLNLILKTNKIMEMPIGFEGMKMKFKDSVLPTYLNTFSSNIGSQSGQEISKAGFYTEFFEDAIDFIIEDGFKDLCVKIIKMSNKYETMKKGHIIYDDEMCDILIQLMNESTMPMFMEHILKVDNVNEIDRTVIMTNMETISSVFELGKYAIGYYVEIRKIDTTIADLLKDKIDLMIAHIIAVITTYRNSDKLTYEDRNKLIENESKFIEGITLLTANAKKVVLNMNDNKKKLTYEFLIKLIQNELREDERVLLVDSEDFEKNELTYRIMNFALNGEYGTLIDAIIDYHDHYLHNFNITPEILIKLIQSEADFTIDASLTDSDTLEDLRNNYRVLKMIINGDYGTITDDFEAIFIKVKEDKLNKVIFDDKMYEDNSDIIMESIQRLNMRHNLGELSVKDKIEDVSLLLMEYNSIELLMGLNEIAMLLFFEFETSYTEIASLIKSEIMYLNKHILGILTAWTNVKMNLSDNVEYISNISSIDIKTIGQMIAKFKALYNDIKKHNFDVKYEDVIEIIRSESGDIDRLMIHLDENYHSNEIVDLLKSIINGDLRNLINRVVKQTHVYRYDNEFGISFDDRFIIGENDRWYFEDLSSIAMDYISGNLNIEEAIKKLSIEFEYSSNSLDGSLNRLITDLEYSANLLFVRIHLQENEVIEKIKNGFTTIFKFIHNLKRMKLAVELGLSDKMMLYSSKNEFHYAIRYLFKLNALAIIVKEHRFDTYLIDIVRDLNNEIQIEDYLPFTTRMDLLKEQLFVDVVEYMINDQFNEFADKLIKCIYINRYINNSYLSITDTISYDSNSAEFVLNTSYLDEVEKLYTSGNFVSSVSFKDNELRHIVTPDMIRNRIMNEDKLFRMNSVHEKACNSFSFKTELITEYEQIVEN